MEYIPHHNALIHGNYQLIIEKHKKSSMVAEKTKILSSFENDWCKFSHTHSTTYILTQVGVLG